MVKNGYYAVTVIIIICLVMSGLVYLTTLRVMEPDGDVEAETNVLVPSPASLSDSALRGADLLGGEDVRLLLESALGLDGQLGRPEGKNVSTLMLAELDRYAR